MKQIVIIGAGPAGLGCAYELSLENLKNKEEKIIIYDKNEIVGGLARTHKYKGYHFDVGPHRFYTKNKTVLALWKKILGEHFIEVPRLTRMLYKNKFFLYPVQLKDVIKNLGLGESVMVGLSFLYSRFFLTRRRIKTFEDWIVVHFGKRLYKHFFKTYTEKVWGIPCSKIGAEWAAQRIKNLNFLEVVKTAIFGERVRKSKSLIDKFFYPTKGSGYFYQKLSKKLEKTAVSINLSTKVRQINHKGNLINSIVVINNDKAEKVNVDYLFSSMPLTEFINVLHPKPPKKVIEAARRLYFRDHITVNFIIKKAPLFEDNWIYVHSPEVKMARIANYNNFSLHMVKNPTYSAISVEYFVFQKDRIWKMTDEQIVTFASAELEALGLVAKKDIAGSFVVRETESYPTYYMGHKKYFDILKNYVKRFSNLELIGRGGMYRYNNMDHSIYSGMLAARNYRMGYKKYDVWAINDDAEYLEEEKPRV